MIHLVLDSRDLLLESCWSTLVMKRKRTSHIRGSTASLRSAQSALIGCEALGSLVTVVYLIQDNGKVLSLEEAFYHTSAFTKHVEIV